MRRFSSWVKLRGTRFSRSRLERVASGEHAHAPASAPSASLGGMRRAPARSTPARSSGDAASEENVVAREDGPELALLATLRTLDLPGDGSSGVYVVERDVRSAGVPEKARKAMNPLLDQVTLVVYGWKSVEPGTLSWVFPSVGAAVAAARTMKNAVRWAIVAGRRENDGDEAEGTPDDALDVARANGAVLIEQAG
jgi:hypothetical protein